MGSASLSISFPQLFSISAQKDANVGDLLGVIAGVGGWYFLWRRPLFVWEFNLLNNLKEVIRSGGVRILRMGGRGEQPKQDFSRSSWRISCLKNHYYWKVI